MRVSDSVRYGGFVPRYHDLLARQIDIQRQISGGIKILRPSDDPAAAARSNQLNSDVASIEQDLRNVEEARAWSDQTEVVLERLIAGLQRANELAVQAGDGTIAGKDRANIAQEIDQILESFVGQGALTSRGRSLFSGSQTDLPAFSVTRNAQGQIATVTYNGNGDARNIETAPERTVAINMLGSNEAGGGYAVFRDTAAGVDLFDTLLQMRGFLEANDQASLMSASLPAIKDGIAHLTLGLAKLGGIQAHVGSAQFDNEDHLDSVRQQLAMLSETDIAGAMIEASQLDTAYRAALATGARILETSLLDYLR